MKNHLHYIFLFFALFATLIIIYGKLGLYFIPYDHAYMGGVYSRSQYVKGTAAEVGIGDDWLFAVAGYYLLFDGGDPTQIHFESPPLGEYLIGLSIFLFHNERVISLIYVIILLLFTYKLAYLIFQDKIAASLALLLISLEPIVAAHMHVSLLDLPQAVFILLGVYFFVNGIKLAKKSQLFLSGIFLGAAASTKFFPGIIFIIGPLGWWGFSQKRKLLRPVLFSFGLIPVIYFLTYIRYFNYHSLWDFINFQKWVIAWRLGNPHVLGNIFYTTFLGKYQSWWGGGWVAYTEWNWITPLIVYGAFSAVLFKAIRQNSRARLLWVVCVLFTVYVAVATTGIAKYLFPILSFLAILAAASIYTLGIRMIKRVQS